MFCLNLIFSDEETMVVFQDMTWCVPMLAKNFKFSNYNGGLSRKSMKKNKNKNYRRISCNNASDRKWKRVCFFSPMDLDPVLQDFQPQ